MPHPSFTNSLKSATADGFLNYRETQRLISASKDGINGSQNAEAKKLLESLIRNIEAGELDATEASINRIETYLKTSENGQGAEPQTRPQLALRSATAVNSLGGRAIWLTEAKTLVASIQADGEVTPSERAVVRAALKTENLSKGAKTLLEGIAKGPLKSSHSAGPQTEDLSNAIKTVWMQGGLDDESQASYVADMVKFGSELGFKVVFQVSSDEDTDAILSEIQELNGLSDKDLSAALEIVEIDNEVSVWGEDNKIFLNAKDGDLEVLVPPRVDPDLVEMAQIYTEDDGYHPFRDGFQGAVAERDESDLADEMAEAIGRTSSYARTYLEGGNTLTGTRKDGKTYSIVGDDSVVISALHLEAEDYFSDAEISRATYRLMRQGELSKRAIDATVEKLMRTYDEMDPDRYDEVDDWRAEAKRFLAILELTKDVIADDLDLERKQVVFVTQPDFHIDMHMRPLGPGKVLLNDPAATLKLINQLLENEDLANWEESALIAMREETEKDLEDLGDVYSDIRETLKREGIQVIRAPGVFNSKGRQANFMNAVLGTSESGQTFFLTNASSIKALEESFAKFLKRQGVDFVGFVGGHGGNGNSYSASEHSLALSGGLDCREVHHNRAFDA